MILQHPRDSYSGVRAMDRKDWGHISALHVLMAGKRYGLFFLDLIASVGGGSLNPSGDARWEVK